MKVKTMIRYLRFRPAEDGGRIFDFSISESEHPNREISVEIAMSFFEGDSRIHLQEGVGISYATIKRFLETAQVSETPLLLYLSAADVALHRQLDPVITKRRPGFMSPQ